MKRILFIIALFLVITVQIAWSQALSTQGVLRDAMGKAVQDGIYDLTFKIYDVETGGIVLWEEPQSVDVVNGIYSVVLGSQISMSSLGFDQRYWLAVVIDGLEMVPRVELTVSPYALAVVSGMDNVFPSSGNVGIGTTSPTEKLDVEGSIYLSGGYRHFGLSGGNSNGYIYGNWPALGDGIHMGYNYYVNSNDEDVIPNLGGGTSRITMGYGSLDFATAGAGAGNPYSKMFINSAGNVGIGTTAPQAKLDVTGAIEVDGIGLPFNYGPNTTYVGTEGNYIAFGHLGTSEDFIGYKNNTFYFKDSPGGADVLDPNVIFGGNVGIGTTSPEAKLDVNGDFKLAGAKPIILHKFDCGTGETNTNTWYSVNDYVAAVAGFHGVRGDIDEHGNKTGSLIRVEVMNNPDGYWHIVADFRSEGNDHEAWFVSVLFIDRRMAELKGY